MLLIRYYLKVMVAKSRKSTSGADAQMQTVAQSSKNIVTVALVVLLVAASFLIGSLWTKVQTLEGKSSGTNVAGAQAQAPTAAQNGAVAKAKPVLVDTDHIRGSADAKVVFIEYSDFDCPFCKSFHPTAKQIFDKYGGEVSWIYRHFPLEQLHPN